MFHELVLTFFLQDSRSDDGSPRTGATFLEY